MRKFWMRLLQVVTQGSRADFWEKSVVWRRVISKYISIYKYSFIYLKLQAYPHSPWGIYALYRYSTWNLFLLSEWTEQKFRLLFTSTGFSSLSDISWMWILNRNFYIRYLNWVRRFFIRTLFPEHFTCFVNSTHSISVGGKTGSSTADI